MGNVKIPEGMSRKEVWLSKEKIERLNRISKAEKIPAKHWLERLINNALTRKK